MKKLSTTIKIGPYIFPTDIHTELRMDTKYAIRKDKVIIRVPNFFSKHQITKTINQVEGWIKTIIENKTFNAERFILKEYKTGKILQVNGKEFILEINENNIVNYKAFLENNVIKIEIPYGCDPVEKNEALIYLQSRIVGDYFAKEVTDRINELNNQYFKVKISNVRLKYNKSNWGSRSAMNNINISTRLLFAPKIVQDYVFIHELAHFFEMNHSPKYWKIVEKVMPEYKKCEKWLKINGPKCDF